jgi:hypothetical protein
MSEEEDEFKTLCGGEYQYQYHQQLAINQEDTTIV